MAYGSIICDLCTEILIYDSYWEITSKDFFKTVSLTEGFFSDDHKNCPLSVLWRCPFYREFHYSKSYTKTTGACEKCPFYGGVRFMEVSVLQRCPLAESWLYIERKTLKSWPISPERDFWDQLAKSRNSVILRLFKLIRNLW